MTQLPGRLDVLRDEVLDIAEHGDDAPRGSEIFDAVVRRVESRGDTSADLDLSLRDAISRRLAWGDDEAEILSSCDAVCERLLRACERALRDPGEEIAVVEAVGEIGAAVARTVALATVARSGRERAALLREQAAEARLGEALRRQKTEIASLRDALSRARRRPSRGD